MPRIIQHRTPTPGLGHCCSLPSALIQEPAPRKPLLILFTHKSLEHQRPNTHTHTASGQLQRDFIESLDFVLLSNNSEKFSLKEVFRIQHLTLTHWGKFSENWEQGKEEGKENVRQDRWRNMWFISNSSSSSYFSSINGFFGYLRISEL